MRDVGRRIRAVWYAMIRRCSDPRNPDYEYYGGRGIGVCERWLKFENFTTDMGDRPLGMTLERKNNEIGYNPSNCIWASQTDQCINRRMFKSNTTGIVGVTKIRTGRYVARFSYKGTRYQHTGSFVTLGEASCARDRLKSVIMKGGDLTSVTGRGVNRNSVTGVTGISWSSTKHKFLVDVTIKGERKHIGQFDTLDEAKQGLYCAKNK